MWDWLSLLASVRCRIYWEMPPMLTYWERITRHTPNSMMSTLVSNMMYLQKCESKFFSVHICIFLLTNLQHRLIIAEMKAEMKTLSHNSIQEHHETHQSESASHNTFMIPPAPVIAPIWVCQRCPLTFPGWSQHQQLRQIRQKKENLMH
jgi:hypothetical protein